MSAPPPSSPAPCRDGAETESNPSPSKLLRLQKLGANRASSVPARRLSSPASNNPLIRPRLHQYHTLDHAVSLFKSAKNIVVLTGAGISTSLGVPDFRSKNGVYDLLEDSVYSDPQELFHIDNFKANPAEFYRQAAKVFPRMQGLVPAGSRDDSGNVKLVPKYSATHAFLAMLQSKGKLLTNYTQNIDGLETAAGLSPSRLIQVHGTLATATCMSCGKKRSARKYMHVVRDGDIPLCKCSEIMDPPAPKPAGRGGKKKRKRYEFEDSDSEDEDNTTELFLKGLLKPDMTFFGEEISQSYAPRLASDKDKIDLLVIIGTSLKVAPVNDLLLVVPPTVPQIWISKDRCQRQGVKVDIELLGECDVVLEEIARRAGWTAALERKLWNPQNSLAIQGPAQKVQRQPEQDKVSTVKPEKGLQIRQKIDAVADKDSAARGSKIQSESNNEKSKAQANAKAKVLTGNEQESKPDTNDKGKEPTPSKNGVHGTDMKSTTSKVEMNGTTKKPKPAPSKVTVELEEGTTWRWYIRRRAK